MVLIENEFGEIGIDSGFLREAGVEIREMNSAGGSDLNFYVGKICGMLFSLIENIRFYFPFPPILQFRCLCPFVVIKKFPGWSCLS